MIRKTDLARIVLSTSLTASSLFAGFGCSLLLPDKIIVGGYSPVDMSESRHAGIIKRRADKAFMKGDFKAATELYGSIGELDKMDEAATRYFDQNPRLGLILLESCERVHAFYERDSE